MLPQLVAQASAQGDVFTAAQARAAGYSRREIERLRNGGCWVALRRGVYTTREVVNAAGGDSGARHRLDVAAALLAIGSEQAWATHQSAAVLWELAFLTPPDLKQVRLTRPGLPRSRSYPGLHLATAAMPAEHRARCGALPAASGARTVVDLACELPFRDGVVLADSALQRKVATPEHLTQVLLDCRHRHGIRDAARIVDFADGRSESVAESLGRVVFAEQGLPVPDLQQWISDERGTIGRVDYLLEQFRTIVEIDGKMKYVPSTVKIPAGITAATQNRLGEIVWREKLREDRLREAGYEVVRVTWSDLVIRPHEVRARVLAAFARASRRYAS
jgi:hypothetical protein